MFLLLGRLHEMKWNRFDSMMALATGRAFPDYHERYRARLAEHIPRQAPKAQHNLRQAANRDSGVLYISP